MTQELKCDSAKGRRGTIIIRAESVKESNHTVVFKISGAGINNKVDGCFGMCGEPGPVTYEVMREIGQKNSERFIPVFKSIPIEGTMDPKWPMHKMRYSKFCNSELLTRMKVRLLVDNTHEVGHIITTVAALTEG